MTPDTAERERQRVAHLVLGELRPRPPAAKRRTRKRPAEPQRLAPGIEEAVALRERWSHKQGTPETLEHASRAQQGALARLYRSGAIGPNQLAAADEIRTTVEAIRADVALPSASWETRVDAGFRAELAGEEPRRRIALAAAYTRWRATVTPIAMLLDIIVDDDPYTVAAARHRIGARRAQALLLAALDHWWSCRRLANTSLPLPR